MLYWDLITPAIPTWLPEELYSGIEFRDMVETAKLWMPEILKQKPDLVVGLFHSGWEHEKTGRIVPLMKMVLLPLHLMFPDLILFSPDTITGLQMKNLSIWPEILLILNGGSRSENIACADITISSKKLKGKRQRTFPENH